VEQFDDIRKKAENFRPVLNTNEVLDYMDRVKAMSPVPVCAGFGIRTADHVTRMQGHVDGVVVGSALVEVLERSEDPAAFLRSLRS
jgi:tryptophan synthase alpha chain